MTNRINLSLKRKNWDLTISTNKQKHHRRPPKPSRAKHKATLKKTKGKLHNQEHNWSTHIFKAKARRLINLVKSLIKSTFKRKSALVPLQGSLSQAQKISKATELNDNSYPQNYPKEDHMNATDNDSKACASHGMPTNYQAEQALAQQSIANQTMSTLNPNVALSSMATHQEQQLHGAALPHAAPEQDQHLHRAAPCSNLTYPHDKEVGFQPIINHF